jgi:predicted acetyltransferase
VYASQPLGWDPDRGGGHALVVRDMVSLTADAYLGLWQHLLGHDLARPIAVEVPLDDPFWQLVQDPWNVNVLRAEGAMIRVVDVERALAARPYVGERPLAFTMRVVDHSAAWNAGVWRVEAADGRMTAERASGEADLELSVNFLAPLFTGFIRPDRAAASGMLKVNRPAALDREGPCGVPKR